MTPKLDTGGMNPAEFPHIASAESALWWYQGMERIFYRFAEPLVRDRCNLRVLEGGCGTGYMSRSLRQRFGWGMFPADLSSVGLAHARRLGLNRLTQADIRHIPFRDASFDAVASFDVIAHLNRGEDERAFREFARVLRPGGLLLVRSSALKMLRSRHSMFVHEKQRYTGQRLRELCTAAGFRITRLTYLNTLLLPIAFLKFRIWEPLTGAKPASGVSIPPAWLNRLLRIPLQMEEAIVRMGVNLPLGQSLLLAAEKPTLPAQHGG